MATMTTEAAERKLVTAGKADERYPVPVDTAFAGDDGELRDFIAAPEIEKIATALRRHHSLLDEIREARIDFRWKLTGGAGGGKVTLGKCVKASGLVKHYSEADFVIWLASDHLRLLQATRWQIEALVYHEICHVGPAFDSEGERIGWKTKAHDFEGFRSEIDNYGFWKDDLKSAARAMQLRLFELEDGGDANESEE